MPSLAAPDAPDALTVRPWPDPVIDSLGYDPRSPYVERFWLGILGPSATWLLRRLAAGLENRPAGFELALDDTARSLGLGARGGRNSPFVRTVARCCQFRLAHLDAAGAELLVRRRLPPLNRTQVARLPVCLQHEHEAWLAEQGRRPEADVLRNRARRLALSLFELGEDVEAAERQLHRWRFHPTMAREAAAWAWSRHQAAAAAVGGPSPDDAGPPPAA